MASMGKHHKADDHCQQQLLSGEIEFCQGISADGVDRQVQDYNYKHIEQAVEDEFHHIYPGKHLNIVPKSGRCGPERPDSTHVGEYLRLRFQGRGNHPQERRYKNQGDNCISAIEQNAFQDIFFL